MRLGKGLPTGTSTQRTIDGLIVYLRRSSICSACIIAVWLLAACSLRSHDSDLPNHLQLRNFIQVYPDDARSTFLMTIPVINNGEVTSPSSTIQVDLNWVKTPAGSSSSLCTNTYILEVPRLEPNDEWTSPELALGKSGACGCVPGQCQGAVEVQLYINKVRPPRAALCNIYAMASWEPDGSVSPVGFKSLQECRNGF